jgi:hypothetical protein
MPRPVLPTCEEIAQAFADPATAVKFPPVLTIGQFAALFQISSRTAKKLLGEGQFNGATSLVGKHRRIWRDRAIQIWLSRERARPKARSDSQTNLLKKGEEGEQATA